MAVSKTLIANLALSHIKDKATLENVDTETTPQAVYTRLWYDQARTQALMDMDMGFSRRRLIMATHDEDPSADWTFRYQWPDKCLLPRFIQGTSKSRDAAPIVFDIEYADDDTLSILTDMDEAILVFTFDVEATTFFTPHFVLAHSFLLAHYVAGPLMSASQKTKDALLVNYNNAINTGGAHEGNVTSSGTQGAPDAEWIRER